MSIVFVQPLIHPSKTPWSCALVHPTLGNCDCCSSIYRVKWHNDGQAWKHSEGTQVKTRFQNKTQDLMPHPYELTATERSKLLNYMLPCGTKTLRPPAA